MPDPVTAAIPLGDLQLYDNYVPALEAGNWRIEVAHTLTDSSHQTINTDPLGAIQEFVVSAPQFSIDSSEIVSTYPPDASTGKYAEVLPHIVLNEPMLPWERQMADAQVQPWLALLVLREEELLGGTGSATRLTTTKVDSFLAPDANVLKPSVTREADVDGASPCSFIQIPTAVFQKIAPRLSELRFLAHCRQANVSDKALQGLNRKGLFSVVVANRFPAASPAGSAGTVKNIVHLVSLEGLEPFLVDQPDFRGHTSVALVSLAAWTFQTLADNLEDFRGLMGQIVATERPAANGDQARAAAHPENLWLRLPVPDLDRSDPARTEALARIADGFVPLAYHTRSGEDTFAWYRGPCTPLLTTLLAKPGPFLTADAALIYDGRYGTFDVSLAGAWEIGRACALADQLFGQRLLEFRQRGHQLTDALLHRLQSDHFSATQIADLSADSTVQDDFLGTLDAQLLQDIKGNALTAAAPLVPAATSDTDPKTAVQNFLADADVAATIAQLVATDLDPIAQWLARLLLLYPVPFHLLVADERMLPVESLRFFHVDTNWTGALLDGAMSIGMESSRQTFYDSLTRDLINRAAAAAALVYRDNLVGTARSVSGAEQTVVSGFLMRSGIVAGWPNLAVRPYLKSGETLKTLRLDHLAPNVLLGLWWGVPDHVEFSEPQEGFRFGVDDDGFIPLRNPVEPLKDGQAPLGQPLGDAFKLQIRSAFLRSADSGVLNLDPGSSDGLIQKLGGALAAATGVSRIAIGPADFALQMVKSPEAIIFTSQTP